MTSHINAVIKLLFALLFLGLKVHAQQTLDSLIDPTAGLIKISDQFSFSEGPAVIKQGDIYFTDQQNEKILKYDINRNLSLFIDKTGRSNGL